MSRVSGPRSPVDTSSESGAERDDRIGTPSARDIKTEGRRFSQMLRKPASADEGDDTEQLVPASGQHARDNARPLRENPGSAAADTPAKEQPIASYPDRQPIPQIEGRSSQTPSKDKGHDAKSGDCDATELIPTIASYPDRQPIPQIEGRSSQTPSKDKGHDAKSDDHDATEPVSMTAAQWAILQGSSGQSEAIGLSRQSINDTQKNGFDPKNLSNSRHSTIASELKDNCLIPKDIDRPLSTHSKEPDDQKDINPRDNRPGAIPENTTRAMGDQILQGLLGQGVPSQPQQLSQRNKVGGPLPPGAPDQRDTSQRKDHQDATVDATTRAGGDQILQGMLNQRMANDQTVSKSPDTINNHIADLANRVAERVLVSDRSVSTDSTVRIKLRDSVLAGSEISIHRDQGQLMVSFNVPDSVVGQQLRTHVGDLQRQLSEKIQQPVNVQVNVSGNTSESGGDGRSRNRRDLNIEWQSDE